MSYLLTQAIALLEEATSYTSCETWSPSLTDEINSFVVNARAALAATPEPAPKPDRTGLTYYKNNDCKAASADAADCICWTPTPPAPQAAQAVPAGEARLEAQAAAEAHGLLHKLRAHIVWLAFGECRSPGWEGPPPTAREAVDAIDAALSNVQPKGTEALTDERAYGISASGGEVQHG